MGSPLVLLVSRSASRVQTYREAFEQLSILCIAISDINEVPVLCAGTPMNGILIDMPVLIKTSSNKKGMIEDILKALPSAYLNIAPATDAIKLLVATGTHGKATNLAEFADICRNFVPRQVVPKDRLPLHLNAILVSGTEANSIIEHTVTINVSSNGCFLFSVNPAHNVNDKVVIDFMGLDDSASVTASICWLCRWGSGNNVPGIGVRFERISDNQKQQILLMLEKVKVE